MKIITLLEIILFTSGIYLISFLAYCVDLYLVPWAIAPTLGILMLISVAFSIVMLVRIEDSRYR